MDTIGVFFCSGCSIGDAIDLDAVAEVADENGAASTHTHPCLCAPEGLQSIRDSISEDSLDGILVAACSERTKTTEFASLVGDDGAPAMYRLSLREHCAWSHEAGDEDTRMLAEDLLRMGLARLKNTKILVPIDETIDDTVLVVGGGRAGLETARTAAQLGHPVVLVEQAGQLGGHLLGLKSVPPEEPPYERPHENPIAALVAEIEATDAITVHTGATIAKITGQPGQFQVTLNTSEGQQQLTAGAIVQATGAHRYDPSRLAHLGYGASPDVMTSDELEKMLVAGRVVRPSDGAAPRRITFVQCAGSRDPEHLSHCSSDCCATTLRQVAELRTMAPDTELAVLYKDMRTPGQLERFYAAVQDTAHPMMTRATVDRVEVNGSLALHLKDSLLGDDTVLESDMVVLATGMVPQSADGEAIRQLHEARDRAQNSESEQQRKSSAELAATLARYEGTEILNLGYRQGPDLPVLEADFPDSHFICFPYETRRTGIYAAGSLRAPMDSAQAAEDGQGAAMKAVQCIEAAKRGEAVHPRAGDRSVPTFFLQRCTQCKRCTEECPFGTLNEDAKGTPEFNVLRCRRCGICMGACPERIISFPDYSVQQIAEMIKVMEVPEDYEEKPRILALMCENDAVPALDAAAANGTKWNPWVRVIPIRCLGSTNIIWIAEALSRGIDGVILIGCKYGDDYQCHYIRGSELAHTRLENVGETLERLALEPERIKTVELSHNEFDRVAQVLDDFADELEALGPNPLKGF